MHNYVIKGKKSDVMSFRSREGWIWCRNERVGLYEEQIILTHSEVRRQSTRAQISVRESLHDGGRCRNFLLFVLGKVGSKDES